MKKILLLFTGGTIGSVKVNVNGGTQIMQPSEARELGFVDAKPLLMDEFHKKFPNYDLSNVQQESVMEILSENMTYNEWNDLTNKLKNVNFNDYDGVIITHGTDTLGYTANYLSFILAGVKVPVMLVSSNFVPGDPKSNGVYNLKSAIDFINNENLNGVFVPYTINQKNSQNNSIKRLNKIIYGSRITQCKSIVDDFDGISNISPYLGYIDSDGKFVTTDYDLYYRLFNNSKVSYINSISRLDTNIMMINPYVGLNYDYLDLGNIDVILHGMYHSGTACVKDGKNSINYLSKLCKQKDTDLYVGPIYGDSDRDLYLSTCQIKDSDIIMNMSSEAAYAKLVVAYNICRNKKEILDFLREPINEEYINDSNVLKLK